MPTTNEDQQTQLEQVSTTPVVAKPEDIKAVQDESAAANVLAESLSGDGQAIETTKAPEAVDKDTAVMADLDAFLGKWYHSLDEASSLSRQAGDTLDEDESGAVEKAADALGILYVMTDKVTKSCSNLDEANKQKYTKMLLIVFQLNIAIKSWKNGIRIDRREKRVREARDIVVDFKFQLQDAIQELGIKIEPIAEKKKVPEWLKAQEAPLAAVAKPKDPESAAAKIVTDALQKPLDENAQAKASVDQFLNAMRYGRDTEVKLSPDLQKLFNNYLRVIDDVLGTAERYRYQKLKSTVENHRTKFISETFLNGQKTPEQLAELLQKEIDLFVELAVSFGVENFNNFIFEGEMYNKKGGIYQKVIPNGSAVYHGNTELEDALVRRVHGRSNVDYNAGFSYEVYEGRRGDGFGDVTKHSDVSVYDTVKAALYARLREPSFVPDEDARKDTVVKSILADMDLHSSMIKPRQAQAEAKRLKMEEQQQAQKAEAQRVMAVKKAEAAVLLTQLRGQIPELTAKLAQAEGELSDLVAQKTKIETTDPSYLSIIRDIKREQDKGEDAQRSSDQAYKEILGLYGKKRQEVYHPGGRNRIQITKLSREERRKQELPLMDKRTGLRSKMIRIANTASDHWREATKLLGDLPQLIKEKENQIWEIKGQIAAKEKAAGALEAESQQIEAELARAA